jgi:hypothetical protein
MDIICQIGVNLLHTIYIDNFVYICTFIMWFKSTFKISVVLIEKCECRISYVCNRKQ